MLQNTTLTSWGLTPVDIDDLQKDDSVKHITRERDMIMSLYLRAKHSERKVSELWDKIETIKAEVSVMFMSGLTLGIIMTYMLYNLW